MFIIFRWWYFAGIAGIGAMAFGGIETSLALKSGPEPTPVTIEQLANGNVPSQPWVRLGAHVALHDHAFALESKGRVKAAFHPVVAADHPYNEAWQALRKRYARVEDVPVGQLPQLSHVRVLVKSAALPAGGARHGPKTIEGSVEGMLFSGSSLDTKERRLLERQLPAHDVEQLLVLDAERRPVPIALAIGTLVLGIATLCWAVRRYRQRNDAS